MADRAEKCAEEIVADVFPSMDTNCAVRYVEQAKKIIRSHFPDDGDLREAAKAMKSAVDELARSNSLSGDDEATVSLSSFRAVMNADKRLRAALQGKEERRG